MNFVGLNLEHLFLSLSQKKIVVAEPLPENMPETIKVLVLRKRNGILDKVRDYISKFLNQSKRFFMTLLLMTL